MCAVYYRSIIHQLKKCTIPTKLVKGLEIIIKLMNLWQIGHVIKRIINNMLETKIVCIMNGRKHLEIKIVD